MTLSILFITKYPREFYQTILAQEDVDSYIKNTIDTLMRAAGIRKTDAVSSQNESERLVFTYPLSDEETIISSSEKQREWITLFRQYFRGLPISFHLLFHKEENALHHFSWEEELFESDLPFILVENDRSDEDPFLDREISEEPETILLGDRTYRISKQLHSTWMEVFESGIQSISKSRRHPLEYNPGDDDRLPPEIREERTQLDTIENVSIIKDRNTLPPEKRVIHLHRNEKPEKASLRAYQDIPIGKKEEKKHTLGGRSLIVACNKDVNLISTWRPGNEEYQVHNASSLHLKASVKKGSLPEAMQTGRVILKTAWIEGHYTPPPLPDVSEKSSRMVWPQLNKNSNSESKKKGD